MFIAFGFLSMEPLSQFLLMVTFHWAQIWTTFSLKLMLNNCGFGCLLNVYAKYTGRTVWVNYQKYLVTKSITYWQVLTWLVNHASNLQTLRFIWILLQGSFPIQEKVKICCQLNNLETGLSIQFIWKRISQVSK